MMDLKCAAVVAFVCLIVAGVGGQAPPAPPTSTPAPPTPTTQAPPTPATPNTPAPPTPTATPAPPTPTATPAPPTPTSSPPPNTTPPTPPAQAPPTSSPPPVVTTPPASPPPTPPASPPPVTTPPASPPPAPASPPPTPPSPPPPTPSPPPPAAPTPSPLTSPAPAPALKKPKKKSPAPSSSLSKALPRPKHFVKNEIPDSILNDASLNAAISLLPANYNFEIHKCVWRIRSMGVKHVALQFPEGLLMVLPRHRRYPHYVHLRRPLFRPRRHHLWRLLRRRPLIHDAIWSTDLLIHYGCSFLVSIDKLGLMRTVKYNRSSNSKTDETESNSERAWMNLSFLLFSPEARSTHVIWLSWPVSRDVLQPVTHSGSKPPAKDSLTNSWIATPVKSATDVSSCTQNVLLRRLWLQ
nr:hypothetical protein Iba_chr06aCG1620 [Ipomoea batatas]